MATRRRGRRRPRNRRRESAPPPRPPPSASPPPHCAARGRCAVDQVRGVTRACEPRPKTLVSAALRRGRRARRPSSKATQRLRRPPADAHGHCGGGGRRTPRTGSSWASSCWRPCGPRWRGMPRLGRVAAMACMGLGDDAPTPSPRPSAKARRRGARCPSSRAQRPPCGGRLIAPWRSSRVQLMMVPIALSGSAATADIKVWTPQAFADF